MGDSAVIRAVAIREIRRSLKEAMLLGRLVELAIKHGGGIDRVAERTQEKWNNG